MTKTLKMKYWIFSHVKEYHHFKNSIAQPSCSSTYKSVLELPYKYVASEFHAVCSNNKGVPNPLKVHPVHLAVDNSQ